MSIRPLLFVLLLLAGTTVASAQRRGVPPEERRAERLARLTEALSLTDAQAVRVDSVLASGAEQMQALREERRGDRRAMRAAMLEHREAQHEAILALLTDPQKEAYTAFLKQEQVGRRPRGRNR